MQAAKDAGIKMAWTKRGANAPAKKQSTTEAGYGGPWAKASKAYREQHPLCVHCSIMGHTAAAQCVDHITPHNGNQVLMWDVDNWQALCHWHHNQKTWRERMGYVIDWKQAPAVWYVCGIGYGALLSHLTTSYPDVMIHWGLGLRATYADARATRSTWHVLAVKDGAEHQKAREIARGEAVDAGRIPQGVKRGGARRSWT